MPGSFAVDRAHLLPHLSYDAVEVLAEDLSSDVALDYLRTFDSILGRRVSRIGAALVNGTQEELETALMSLQAGSAMAGASRLYRTATSALRDLQGKGQCADDVPVKLEHQSVRFRAAYRCFLVQGLTSAA